MGWKFLTSQEKFELRSRHTKTETHKGQLQNDELLPWACGSALGADKHRKQPPERAWPISRYSSIHAVAIGLTKPMDRRSRLFGGEWRAEPSLLVVLMLNFHHASPTPSIVTPAPPKIAPWFLGLFPMKVTHNSWSVQPADLGPLHQNAAFS